MKSIFLICLRIASDRHELDAFAEQVSSLLGGQVKTRLARATEFHKGSARYWTSRYFVTSFDKISDDVMSLLALVPDDALRPFAGSISVCLIDQYNSDDDRNGLYLSVGALQAMARIGADFDLDMAEQGGFDDGKFMPVPNGG
ncbi:hypothetical protein [Luteibacter sp. PvP120]